MGVRVAHGRCGNRRGIRRCHSRHPGFILHRLDNGGGLVFGGSRFGAVAQTSQAGYALVRLKQKNLGKIRGFLFSTGAEGGT